MELNLEVLLSSSIKRKKPWPQFCWLGEEMESVFLLDDKRISEINMVSGRTKKRIPKLHSLLSSVVTLSNSHTGMWLCGLLVTGELFLWNRDKELLKMAAAASHVVQMITDVQGNSSKLSLTVSWDGRCVLLVAITGQVLLWECTDVKDSAVQRDGPVHGHWAQISPLENIILPSTRDKEAMLHTIFVRTERMGDICLSAFVFTSGKELIVTCLKIQWEESHLRSVSSVGYNVQWTTKTYPMSRFTPPCQPVKSRGALVSAFSPDGQLLAIVLNQRNPKATQVLFVSTQNFITMSSSLGGCGSKTLEIPSKYIRSYWVASVNWSPGGLFLACVLKRGSLLMLARLGGLLTLKSTGCNVEFGPAHFLPLHPLVTYRPSVVVGQGDASLSSSSMSRRDVLRQRYSVTWHPKLLYLIVSDGYMATLMKVLDRTSPTHMMKALLHDASRELEKASRMLHKSQNEVKEWLEWASCLNLDNTIEDLNSTLPSRPNTTDPVITTTTEGSDLPVFLQEQQSFGGTKELFESVQAFFEDDSDVDGVPVGSHVEDSGCLEFASMYDTIHALEPQADVASPEFDKDLSETVKKPAFHSKLEKIQSKLLTAWAFGMSQGNAVKQRGRFLKQLLSNLVRFVALLHLAHRSAAHGRKKSSPKIQHLIESLLAFLPWDISSSDGPGGLGLLVDLTKLITRLLLTPLPEPYCTNQNFLSSENFTQVMAILQLVSGSLDDAYTWQQTAIVEEDSPSHSARLRHLDVYSVPDMKEEEEEKLSFKFQTQLVPQRPSSRLLGVYQMVYHVTKQYVEELKSFKEWEGWEEEVQQMSVITSQIQSAVQATGERLEGGPVLLSHQGEHLFLCGSYTESADTWRLQLHKETNKSCGRSVFQETRLCLALLYNLLSQYRLREAQEFGDHMARIILVRGGVEKVDTTAGVFFCSQLPMSVHSDAAFAAVQTLGRFMASYFTNQPLHILPPHNVAILPAIHLPHSPCASRLVSLCQEEVAKAVREQHLSELWTVEYAQDLLLLGGLLPEAVWLAYHLGDWKTAISLSLAYSSYCSDHFDFACLRKREHHLPTALKPECIFQAELNGLLGTKADIQACTQKDNDKSFRDPLEEDERELLQISIHEILKAAVIAGVEVMSSPVSSLLDAAKDLCSVLSTFVPNELYLPSPPLYCPQPSPNTQDQIGATEHFAEVTSRHKVSEILQKLLLLFRSGRCCHPAAQWYISRLQRARHILHKIKKKYSYPSAAEKEKEFPEGLRKFISRSSYFRRGPNKDGRLDPDTSQIIVCFRELCALCWMLHVRDQLSIYCRRYQVIRQQWSNEPNSGNAEVTSAAVEALHWVCRLLPFSHFLNAEEDLQDILLSLAAELPPVSLVADALVKAFPEEEESVRVSLREKYNLLLQRLRQCSVLEEEKGEESELMMVVIQDKFRLRGKHLARVQRHLAPPVLQLWDKEEEEDDDRGSKHRMALLQQLSLGTSVSTSTLNDCALAPMCSDGDTTDNTGKAVTPDPQSGTVSCGKKVKKKKKGKLKTKKTAAKKFKSSIPEEECERAAKETSTPVVGTWEFELEDDEYLNFLELFLSYVLEKDSTDRVESSCEVPLLKGFCSEVREKELHSLTFDVVSTIHRHQRDGHHPARKRQSSDLPIFRAGFCYKTVKQGATSDILTSTVCSEAHVSRTSPCFSSEINEKPLGLFGLRQKNNVTLNQNVKRHFLDSKTSQSDVSTQQQSFLCGTSLTVEAVGELQQGLDSKLEAQFPELGRLLEWTVRWADRRMLIGHHGKRKKDEESRAARTADHGVMIRVKTSAPAILTSLSLLRDRYSALLKSDHYRAHTQVPQTRWITSPVLQPEVERKLETESSVDAGYPGSASMPITALEPILQEEEPSETCQPAAVQDQLTSEDQQTVFNFQSEKEGKATDNSEVSSTGLSQNLYERNDSSEESLRLADLECSEKYDTSTTTSLPAGSLHTSFPQRSITPATQVQPLVSTMHSESAGSPQPQTTVHPPGFQSHTSAPEPPIMGSIPQNQPSTHQIPPVSANLGEDLFRLVQHINYMSLREVLGASFSNFQLAQQSSILAQSNMAISHPNVASSCSTNMIPQPTVLPSQPSLSATPQTNTGNNHPHFSHQQASQCMFTDQQPTQSPVKVSSVGIDPTSRIWPLHPGGANVTFQEMQPLSVQAGSPVTLQRHTSRLIPSSQGLLVTSDNNPPAPSTPGAALSLSSHKVMGVKLLQHQHPILPQQSDTQLPPTQCTSKATSVADHQHWFRHRDQIMSMRTGREENIGSSVPKTSHSYDAPPQHHNVSLPYILAAQIAAPMQGHRLLHFQPDLSTNVSFPKVNAAFFPKASTFIRTCESPVLKLLRIESGPKMISPLATPSARVTRLTSLEDVTTSATERQSTEIINGIDRRAISSTRLNPRKRDKRREEKAGKPAVSFRPNESIIPAQEPSDILLDEQPTGPEDTTPTPSFSTKCVSSDSSLTGQRLLDKVMSTSAELHVFAATCKKPPECHDAFTNTEAVCPPVLMDKAVSAQASTMTSAQSIEHFQVGNENLVQDKGIAPQETKTILEPGGRQFISVFDLDDMTPLQDLSPIVNREAQEASLNPPPSPTVAELHVLATSVIRSHSAASDSGPPAMFSEKLQISTNHTGDHQHGEDSVSVTQAPCHSEVCKAIMESAAPHRSSFSSNPTVWFSSRLSEMDAQLVAIQNIADHLENDFSNTSMLVNAPEKLSPNKAPTVKPSRTLKKRVRLFVPHRETAANLDLLPEPGAFEEKQEDHEEYVLHQDFSSPGRKTAWQQSTPLSHRKAPSPLCSPPSMTDQFCEEESASNLCTDEPLGQDELSDTIELLNELVKEGYLSPTDLDFLTLHSANQTRTEQPQSSHTSQELFHPEDDRRELRIWMRKKQREKLAVYQKHRETLRERERKPFSSSRAAVKPTCGIREEKEKSNRWLLLEHYKQRMEEACSLAGDILTSPVSQHGASHAGGFTTTFTARPVSAPQSGSTNRADGLSAAYKRNPGPHKGQTSKHIRSQSTEPQEHGSVDYCRRFGLHRPVTALPKDRLSQITKQGMITVSKSHAKPLTAKGSSGRPQRLQTQTSLNRTYTSGAADGVETVSEQRRVKGSQEIDTYESKKLQSQPLEEHGDISSMCVSGMEWLDHLSDSEGSNLSKIDWAAIERMAAAEEGQEK
ncbi:ciliogenesis and planar polarity effector 1 isoform X2 [Gouania willdenowi]|uniref:ciliogenesis and planar polarity effector 1 isoform X2 n=1 Tax=Gouania willdenowi TaxID=441366 RepID=UPI0010560546|nr:ciliogenesis and planar polarity effector 1 isoform X2 [Gouania willdenowi]